MIYTPCALCAGGLERAAGAAVQPAVESASPGPAGPASPGGTRQRASPQEDHSGQVRQVSYSTSLAYLAQEELDNEPVLSPQNF